MIVADPAFTLVIESNVTFCNLYKINMFYATHPAIHINDVRYPSPPPPNVLFARFCTFFLYFFFRSI